MGHAGTFHYACALTALVLLTGCDDRPRMWSESELQEIVRETRPLPYGGPASGDDIIVIQEELNALKTEVDGLKESVSLGLSVDEATSQRIDHADERLAAIEDVLYR